MKNPDHSTSTVAELWAQDRALLAEHGPSHIESISETATDLRIAGRAAAAAELDRQCARMRIIAMGDEELERLCQRTDREHHGELVDIPLHQAEHRDPDT